MRYLDTLKKMFVLAVAAISISVVYMPNSIAASLVKSYCSKSLIIHITPCRLPIGFIN